MDIGENLTNSFDYTKKLLTDGGRLIILIVLHFIFVGIPIEIGYVARVLRESPGTDAPPKLENYGQLFVDGLRVLFVDLIYMLIPLILIGVGFVSLFAGFLSLQGGTFAPNLALSGVGVVLVLVGFLLAILLLILLGVGTAHMLKTRKLGKAFAFGEILNIIRAIGWGKYLVWIIITFVLSTIVGGLAGAVTSVAVLGWILSSVISPFLNVFLYRSLGLLYNDGAPPELRAQPVAVTGLACSSCGTPLQPHHKFCPSCGAPAPAPPPPPTPTSAGEGTRFCMSCGAKIPSTAKFCGICGAEQK